MPVDGLGHMDEPRRDFPELEQVAGCLEIDRSRVKNDANLVGFHSEQEPRQRTFDHMSSGYCHFRADEYRVTALWHVPGTTRLKLVGDDADERMPLAVRVSADDGSTVSPGEQPGK